MLRLRSPNPFQRYDLKGKGGKEGERRREEGVREGKGERRIRESGDGEDF